MRRKALILAAILGVLFAGATTAHAEPLNPNVVAASQVTAFNHVVAMQAAAYPGTQVTPSSPTTRVGTCVRYTIVHVYCDVLDSRITNLTAATALPWQHERYRVTVYNGTHVLSVALTWEAWTFLRCPKGAGC